MSDKKKLSSAPTAENTSADVDASCGTSASVLTALIKLGLLVDFFLLGWLIYNWYFRG